MQRVLLYGRSLFIAGIQASLEDRPGLELQDVEAQTESLQACISAWEPDALIFELTGTDPIPSLAVLKDHPNLLLIGVDLERNGLPVLTRRLQKALSVADLVEIIQRVSSNFEPSQRNPQGNPKEEVA